MQTTTDEYKKERKNRCSNEMQTILDLLSKEKEGYFLFGDLEADLNQVYLAGIDLDYANLNGADLTNAYLFEINLTDVEYDDRIIFTDAILTNPSYNLK